MTREYILQNLEVMCPIIFIDNPELRDYVMSTLQDSILIPKPKFKVGDVVKVIYGEKTKWKIEGRYYSPDEMKWYYSDFGDMISYSEDELELVEEKNETN